MAQIDLYRNNDVLSNEVYPFFIDVKNDLLSSLKTRVVAPLVLIARQDSLIPTNLCSRVDIQGQSYILLTQLISTVS